MAQIKLNDESDDDYSDDFDEFYEDEGQPELRSENSQVKRNRTEQLGLYQKVLEAEDSTEFNQYDFSESFNQHQ